eukprot:8646423-Prorocentrum_lima.AAC.1
MAMQQALHLQSPSGSSPDSSCPRLHKVASGGKHAVEQGVLRSYNPVNSALFAAAWAAARKNCRLASSSHS